MAESRPLHEIADDIVRTWPNIYFAAAPYVNAMRYLNTINDMYGADPAKEIVLRFVGNAATWRGEDARRIKAELRGMLR